MAGAGVGTGTGAAEAVATAAPASARALDAGALAVLEAQERVLVYPERFGAAEALELGCAIARRAAAYDRGVTVEIVRASDGMQLFAWSMDDKAPRNFTFTAGKRRVVEACGHASLWAYVDHEVTGGSAALCDFSAGYCASGGAFPVRVQGEFVATVAVSGLHEGKDHELVVRGLADALVLTCGTDVPEFTYQAV